MPYILANTPNVKTDRQTGRPADRKLAAIEGAKCAGAHWAQATIGDHLAGTI